jgi:hypothetical protein
MVTTWRGLCPRPSLLGGPPPVSWTGVEMPTDHSGTFQNLGFQCIGTITGRDACRPPRQNILRQILQSGSRR